MVFFTDINQIDSMQGAYKAVHDIHKNVVRIWMEDSLFTWQWWLGVGLTIIPWIIWLIVHKKDCTDRLLYAGLATMLIASWLDFIGISFGLWSYNYTVVPAIPAYIPWDFSLIPTIIMLLIQYKPKLRPLIKAIFFGGMSAFVGGPFFVWINLYNMHEWKYIYSFVIYIILYLIIHRISKRQHFNTLKTRNGRHCNTL